MTASGNQLFLESMMENTIPRQPKIVIIGAGLAGLAAGKFLELEGFVDYVILEASDRIGGRIHTLPIDNNGRKVEMGANWIHGIKDNPIYKLADDNKLLHEREGVMNSKNIYITEDRKIIDEKNIKDVDFSYGTILSKCEDHFIDNDVDDLQLSLGDELKRKIEDKLSNIADSERHNFELVYHQRLLLECCISGCDDLSEVSLSQFGSYKELPGVHLVIPKGFSAILDIVKKGIPDDKIKVKKPVKKIAYGSGLSENKQCSEDKVCVECEDGDTFYADHVIVTVSLGVLKRDYTKMFSPALPENKASAIQRLGFGLVNKVILVLETPLEKPLHRIHLAWEPDESPKDDLKDRWFRKIYSLEVVHDNVLIGWLSGQEAHFLETLSDEDLMKDLSKVLEKFLPAYLTIIPKIKEVKRTRWFENYYTRGSYSFIAVGASQKDVLDLKSPLTIEQNDHSKKPVVLFAGEATHPSYYSTTHGALLTGNREAARICKYWKPNIEDEIYKNLGLSDEDSEEEKENGTEQENGEKEGTDSEEEKGIFIIR